MGPLAELLTHRGGQRPHGDKHLDAQRSGVCARFAMEATLVGPQLEHVAKHGDPASAGAIGEVV